MDKTWYFKRCVRSAFTFSIHPVYLLERFDLIDQFKGRDTKSSKCRDLIEMFFFLEKDCWPQLQCGGGERDRVIRQGESLLQKGTTPAVGVKHFGSAFSQPLWQIGSQYYGQIDAPPESFSLLLFLGPNRLVKETTVKFFNHHIMINVLLIHSIDLGSRTRAAFGSSATLSATFIIFPKIEILSSDLEKK